MDARGIAENITVWMREKGEHITALKAALGRELSHARLKAFESKVLDEIAHGRFGPPYCECESVAQFQRQLDDAKDNNSLLQLLYALSLGQSDVGTY